MRALLGLELPQLESTPLERPPQATAVTSIERTINCHSKPLPTSLYPFLPLSLTPSSPSSPSIPPSPSLPSLPSLPPSLLPPPFLPTFNYIFEDKVGAPSRHSGREERGYTCEKVFPQVTYPAASVEGSLSHDFRHKRERETPCPMKLCVCVCVCVLW